jgi:hypothetical protein
VLLEQVKPYRAGAVGQPTAGAARTKPMFHVNGNRVYNPADI